MVNCKKKIIFVLLILFVLFSFACKSNAMDELSGYDVKVIDFNLFKNNDEIILPKNQIEAQNLSVIVKSENGELIIFDGGRVEDAEYLHSIIKSLGGNVSAWFLTHIHDDHIGAIYEILKNKYYDVNIKNLYFNFASFNWYYDKIGNDAGALNLFLTAINDYNANAEKKINVISNLEKGNIYNVSDVEIEILNNMYMLDEDSINNTSIVYRVNIFGVKMLILGDLGYDGGDKLISETEKEKLESDICVLSHHGQNGVPLRLYGIINPKICIWPTTKKIYENTNKKYNTDDTKAFLNKLNVENIVTYEKTVILK